MQTEEEIAKGMRATLYRSMEGRARLAISLLRAKIIFMLSLFFLWLIIDIASPTLETNGSLVTIVYITTLAIGLLLSLVAAIAFFFWLHGVYINMHVLSDKKLKYSPRWAVYAFLIPFINLVMPIIVMREAWKASISQSVMTNAAPGTKGSISLIYWWWISLWLLLLFAFTPINQLTTYILQLEISYLTILIVRQIQAGQVEKSNLV